MEEGEEETKLLSAENFAKLEKEYRKCLVRDKKIQKASELVSRLKNELSDLEWRVEGLKCAISEASDRWNDLLFDANGYKYTEIADQHKVQTKLHQAWADQQWEDLVMRQSKDRSVSIRQIEVLEWRFPDYQVYSVKNVSNTRIEFELIGENNHLFAVLCGNDKKNFFSVLSIPPSEWNCATLFPGCQFATFATRLYLEKTKKKNKK